MENSSNSWVVKWIGDGHDEPGIGRGCFSSSSPVVSGSSWHGGS